MGRLRGKASKLTVMAMLTGLGGPAVAQAHIERPAYWPDPAPDTSVTPPAATSSPGRRR